MSLIGVLIETRENEIKKSIPGIITAACSNNEHTACALILNNSTEFHTEASGCKDASAYKEALEEYGIERIIEISSGNTDLNTNPDLKAQALIDTMKHFDIKALIGLSSPVGKDILTRTASSLNVPSALDCVAVDFTEHVVTKSHFSGKTIARVKLESEYFICGIRPNSIEAVKKPCTAEIVTHQTEVSDKSGIKVKEIKKASSDSVDLTEATIIITGGRPIASADNFSILEECATALGGGGAGASVGVGASRAAVDSGFAPHSMQVGQTGKTVSPQLYIGCGLSGSVQHFAGMKTSKVIVAINTDKDAPIFGKCDYGILGDLFEVVPALTLALKEKLKKD